jgi:hypothetical protein
VVDYIYLASIWTIRLFNRCCDIYKDLRFKIPAIKSGRPEGSHLQSPSEPYVNLSIHTAPVSHSLEASQFQADAERN